MSVEEYETARAVWFFWSGFGAGAIFGGAVALGAHYAISRWVRS